MLRLLERVPRLFFLRHNESSARSFLSFDDADVMWPGACDSIRRRRARASVERLLGHALEHPQLNPTAMSEF
jgi:hypothetical protein